jgi:hypothetical protein
VPELSDGQAVGAGPSSVNCLVCGTAVPLDPRKMSPGPDYATVPCTACSALVPLTAEEARSAEQVLEAVTPRRFALDYWRTLGRIVPASDQVGPPER